MFFDAEGRPIRHVAADDSEFRTALEALRDFELLLPILATVDRIEGGHALLEGVLRDDPLPHAGNQSPGRDAQTELLVASTCALGGMDPVSIEEPDVKAVTEGQPWRIAVKRVKSQRRIDDNLRRAADQTGRWEDPGVVFLDVSLAFDPDDQQVTRPMPREEFHHLLGEGLRRGIQRIERRVFERARAKGVGVVYFYFSCLRLDPESGWELGSIHMDVDTAVDDATRAAYWQFRAAFSAGIERLGLCEPGSGS